MMIRLRVSTLEQFRKVSETDYESEANLIERIRRGQWADDGPQEWYMQAGTAWHRAMACDHSDEIREEKGEDGSDVCTIRYGDFWFASEDIQAGLRHCGPGLREVTGRQVFGAWGNVPIQIEGTTDLIHGLGIQDHKTKFSSADPDDYEPSLQWRFYLLIHEAIKFRYNLFEMRDPDENNLILLKEICSFRFWPYPGMDADCGHWLRRFMEWADSKRLIGYLVNDRPR